MADAARANGPRIALSGYYGCGNTGDEAVLAGIVESFRRRGGDNAADFTVLSQDPADTERRHGLRAVDRMKLASLRAALRESDLLISGGGSLLQDTTSVRSLLYYLWVVRLALKCGAPVMFYAQGLGPLRRPVSRFLTRVVANRVQCITVRDPGSAALLKTIGVCRPPIEVTADPAFALTPAPPEEVEAALRAAGAPTDGRPLVGIALRPWHATGGPTVADFARMADRVAEQTGAHPVFLPMQPPGDVALSEQVAAAMSRPATVVKGELSPRLALGLVGAMSGVVAMRLHALIFAAVGAVPMAALSYDPKVAQLMAGLEQSEYALDLAEFAADRAADLAVAVVAQSGILRPALRARADAFAERALVNVDRALAVAGRRSG